MPCELYDSAMEYLRRIIDDELDDLFSQVPAIAIDGPKAVGKTTTAEQRARGLLKLDSRANRASIQADPELVRTRVRPLLIDARLDRESSLSRPRARCSAVVV